MRRSFLRPTMVCSLGALVVLFPIGRAAAETRTIWVQNCSPYPARISMLVKTPGIDWQPAYTSGPPVDQGNAVTFPLANPGGGTAAMSSHSGVAQTADPDGIRIKAEFLDPLSAANKARTIGQATLTEIGRFDERDRYLFGFQLLATAQHQFAKYSDVQFSGKSYFIPAPGGDSKAPDRPVCQPLDLPTAPAPAPKAT